MTLKFVVDALDGVPEPARAFYTERDGKFVLDAEGAVAKSRLDAFRENNLALTREIAELQQRFEGIDPEQARHLAERTEAVSTEFASIASERDRLNAQLESLVVDGAIRDEAARAGVRPAAIEDVLLRGRAVFRLEDGRAIAFNGKAPASGSDGEPLGVAEWVASLAARAPHLFEPSRGGGAPKGAMAGESPRAGLGTIDRHDKASFLAHVDDIASGRVKVA